MDPRLNQVQHEEMQRATSIKNRVTADGNTNAIYVGKNALVAPAQEERAPKILLPKPNQTPSFRELPTTHTYTLVSVDRLEFQLEDFIDYLVNYVMIS